MADQQQGIQELMARANIKEAFESVVGLGDSVVDDAVEHCIFASAAVQAQGYPGYYIPVIKTRLRYPECECWDWSERELYAGLNSSSTKH